MMPIVQPLRCLVLAAVLSTSAAQAEVVLIASATSPIDTLSNDQVTAIFLGKLTRLPGGLRVTPIDAPDGAAERDAFYLLHAGKSPAQMRAYWSKLMFTGRSFPPREAASSVALKKLVAGNNSFIGYIDDSALDASVKVIPVVK